MCSFLSGASAASSRGGHRRPGSLDWCRPAALRKRGPSATWRLLWLGRHGLLRVRDEVAGPRRVHLHARTERRGERDRADVLALRGRGLGSDELLDDRLIVLQQLLVREGRLAEGEM